MIWIDSCELYVFTKVVTAVTAKETFAARDTRLYSYAIAYNIL
jgi:hypothetical protein